MGQDGGLCRNVNVTSLRPGGRKEKFLDNFPATRKKKVVSSPPLKAERPGGYNRQRGALSADHNFQQ